MKVAEFMDLMDVAAASADCRYWMAGCWCNGWLGVVATADLASLHILFKSLNWIVIELLCYA